ncbi:MAG: response regulator [Oscillospiraceae bacterium]|nr:response regulator [Oscillospiraceae bacterium]
MNTVRRNHTAEIAVIGSLILAVILVAGTIWMGRSARKDTEEAVRTVSLLYLDELAGRREQVVENNLEGKIDTIRVAIDLMTEEDLSDKEHLQNYQSRMKRLYTLDKFAFVDTDGLIYTSVGYQTDIEKYKINYKTLADPEISVLDLADADKSVIIAVPTQIAFQGKTLSVCFMEISMEEMLSGVSVKTNTGDATFCNIYTAEGTALTNAVLGGLAEEDNLLDAMMAAEFERPYTYEAFAQDFQNGERGVVSFAYNGIRETLAYIPVKGTDWQLTYLIRESVISNRISSISEGTIRRSILQSAMTVADMLIMFGFIITQTRKNNNLLLEREKTEAENRVKQEELEHRLALQEKLLEEERLREREEKMITALSADYWSVYYLELDRDEGICFQSHADLDGAGFQVGERFRYLASVTAYAERYVTEQYREEFLHFVQPESIREGLKGNRVTSYTYMVNRHGKESYETVRFAGVRHPEDREDHVVHNVGACFIDVDAETRKAMEQHQALSDALAAAKEANRAKTAFLSNMSHEIRTPMNAIIGLDNIALNDPETPSQTREYLEKIGASAEHLLNLINDILDMTRIESGRMTMRNEEFSFSKLLEAVNTMFSSQCHEKGLDYQCHINGEVDDRYIGDNMKLRQVLINILGNAIKFTPAGGKVDFQVERKADYDGKSVLQFTISDTGIGMKEEFIPHIFDTFAQEDSSTTSKYGSSGLGLAITKNIVELMNGNIEVKSTKGKGTTFVVTVTLKNAARSNPRDGSAEILPGDMTVLIVDDDPIACRHASLVLEKEGIAAETAASGEEAVEKVRLHHARREPYNLILVDWLMPEMDGVETTREIRAVTGDESAIIILTAYKWDDVLDEALQAGVDSFIAKPLFAAPLLEEFKAALQRKKLTGRQDNRKAELSGRMVLLAEDVEVNAEIMEMVLQTREVKADLAENGRIAVEKFASHPVGYYDAILMDMRMPEMDGLEATRTIRMMDRADAKTIPIIALTANAFDEDVQRSLQAGLNAHLSKPVHPEALFETLENLIKD